MELGFRAKQASSACLIPDLRKLVGHSNTGFSTIMGVSTSKGKRTDEWIMPTAFSQIYQAGESLYPFYDSKQSSKDRRGLALTKLPSCESKMKKTISTTSLNRNKRTVS